MWLVAYIQAETEEAKPRADLVEVDVVERLPESVRAAADDAWANLQRFRVG